MDNDGERYNEYGTELDNEVSKLLMPLIQKYIKHEFSIRDIEYIINGATREICLLHLIGWATVYNERGNNELKKMGNTI